MHLSSDMITAMVAERDNMRGRGGQRQCARGSAKDTSNDTRRGIHHRGNASEYGASWGEVRRSMERKCARETAPE